MSAEGDVDAALAALEEAHAARGIAVTNAIEAIWQRFAPIVAKREKAYNDALRAAGDGPWSIRSGTGPSDMGG